MIRLAALGLALWPVLPAPGPLSAAPSPPPVSARDFEATRRASVQTMIADLEALATWCQRKKAYQQRNIAYELILLEDENHADARKFLGWRWDRKSETWTRKDTPRAPRDLDVADAREAEERRGRILQSHKARILAALDGDPAPPRAVRAEALRALLDVLPEDAELHAMNGQVRAPDSTDEDPKWILAASARALEWRKRLAERKRKLFAEVPTPTACALAFGEEDIAIEWRVVKRNDRMRALSTGGEGEVDRALQVCHVVWDYTRDLFGHDLDPEFNLYLLTRPGDLDPFLEHWTDLSPEMRKQLHQMVGNSFSSRDVAVWSDTDDRRFDGACRQMLAHVMVRRFNITAQHGWAHEGFGMYITHALLGTRLSFFVRQTDYVEDGSPNLSRVLNEPGADWLALARRELAGAKVPNLSYTLGRDVNTLTAADQLLSNALASFLLEGHEPEVTQKILGRIGAGENPVTVFEQELGYDILTLAVRLRTYLEEIGK